MLKLRSVMRNTVLAVLIYKDTIKENKVEIARKSHNWEKY